MPHREHTRGLVSNNHVRISVENSHVPVAGRSRQGDSPQLKPVTRVDSASLFHAENSVHHDATSLQKRAGSAPGDPWLMFAQRRQHRAGRFGSDDMESGFGGHLRILWGESRLQQRRTLGKSNAETVLLSSSDARSFF
jgi:hypothetical protein